MSFPNGTVWANELDGGGYDVFLLGDDGPMKIDLDRSGRAARGPQLRARGAIAAQRRILFRDGAALRLCRPGAGSAALAHRRRNQRDGNLRLQYMAGLALNTSQEGGIYEQMLSYRRFPANLFTGSEARLQALAAAIEAGGTSRIEAVIPQCFLCEPSGAPVSGSRLALMAGFGGLLLMMAFAEFDSIAALRQIQNSTDAMRQDFVWRTRLLERIRDDVYVSGTYVRDYLLEPEAGKAEGHRDSLLETRRDMDAALAQYRTLVTARESAAVPGAHRRAGATGASWSRSFSGARPQRRRDGFPFLRDEVFPRRMAMIGIADQIRAINESQMTAGKARWKRHLRCTGGG